MAGGPLLGSGGFYGSYGPSGPYGAWPTCGCSSLLIIIAGIILVCAGVMQMGGGYHY
ncbi:MAG TPA: hypothetical protein VJ739_20010 [Gemmataceae bacterium]|nr:hypothetical protein [Gemmataceae bacterium]